MRMNRIGFNKRNFRNGELAKIIHHLRSRPKMVFRTGEGIEKGKVVRLRKTKCMKSILKQLLMKFLAKKLGAKTSTKIYKPKKKKGLRAILKKFFD